MPMTLSSSRGGLLLLTLAFSHVQALEPEAIYEKVASSVLVVRALDGNEKPIASGSGIVVARGKVVTICSMLARARGVQVTRDNMIYKAILEFPDTERDLCQLDVKDLPAPALEVGTGQNLKVGQRIYTVSAPKGAELALTDGMVSSLRDAGGGVPMIDVTAKLSRGSGGGGVFDANGRIIGVIASQLRTAQPSAIPADWLNEISQRGKAALAKRLEPPPTPRFPRQIRGEELAAHIRDTRSRIVQLPMMNDIDFRPAGVVIVKVPVGGNPSGRTVEGRYEVRPTQDQVCLHMPNTGYNVFFYIEYDDCFTLHQVAEKTYQLKAVKGTLLVVYDVP